MHLIHNFVLKQVALFLRIQLVPVSSLSIETGYSEKIFIVFLSPSMYQDFCVKADHS